jgi:hypothetical protein
LTTAALFALTTAFGLWLFPIVSGKLSPTASGAVAAYHAIDWATVWIVAAVGAVFAIIAPLRVSRMALRHLLVD